MSMICRKFFWLVAPLVLGVASFASNANAAFVFQAVVSGNDSEALDYLRWIGAGPTYQFLAKQDMPSTISLAAPATSFSVSGGSRSETWTLGGTVADIALVKIGSFIAIYTGSPSNTGSFNLDADLTPTPTIWERVGTNPLNFAVYTPPPPANLTLGVSHVSVYYRGGGAPVIPEPAAFGIFLTGLVSLVGGPFFRHRRV
jgi:hypothetical protein